MHEHQKKDLLDFLGQIKREEVEYILAQLRAGRIEGGAYRGYDGNCGCLFGALAEKRGMTIDRFQKTTVSEQFGIRPGEGEDRWSSRDFETYTTAIHPGHTPENNDKARVLAEVIEEFLGGAS